MTISHKIIMGKAELLFALSHFISFPEVGDAVSEYIIRIVVTVGAAPDKAYYLLRTQIWQCRPEAGYHAAHHRRGERCAVSLGHTAASVNHCRLSTHGTYVWFHAPVLRRPHA